MFSLIRECFTWLPGPLGFLVNTVITIFVVIVAFEILKIVWELVRFLADIFGGIFQKVVTLFLG